MSSFLEFFCQQTLRKGKSQIIWKERSGVFRTLSKPTMEFLANGFYPNSFRKVVPLKIIGKVQHTPFTLFELSYGNKMNSY